MRKTEKHAVFLFDAIENISDVTEEGNVTKLLSLRELGPGMILDEDVVSPRGVNLCSKGTELTSALIARLRNIARGMEMTSSVRVLVPAGSSQ